MKLYNGGLKNGIIWYLHNKKFSKYKSYCVFLEPQGRQEDAEEFLSFLLNGIHEELVELKKLTTPPTPTNDEDSEDIPLDNGNGVGMNEDEESWEQVGRKNKSSTMRKVFFSKIILSLYKTPYLQKVMLHITLVLPSFDFSISSLPYLPSCGI